MYRNPFQKKSWNFGPFFTLKVALSNNSKQRCSFLLRCTGWAKKMRSELIGSCHEKKKKETEKLPQTMRLTRKESEKGWHRGGWGWWKGKDLEVVVIFIWLTYSELPNLHLFSPNFENLYISKHRSKKYKPGLGLIVFFYSFYGITMNMRENDNCVHYLTFYYRVGFFSFFSLVNYGNENNCTQFTFSKHVHNFIIRTSKKAG